MRMSGTKYVVLLSLLASSLLIVPLKAHAGSCTGDSLCLTLTDENNNTMQMGSNNGLVNVNGTLGAWTINNVTGEGQAALSLPDLLDLNSINTIVNGSGSHTLTITLLETGLTSPIGKYTTLSSIGGTAVGVLTFQTLFIGGPSNGTTSLANLTGLTGKPFSGSQNGFADFETSPTQGNTYTLETIVTITQNGSGNNSFDADLSIPEPATLSVLGTGLLALGTGLRNRLLRA